jgi:hypothetical protein
MYVFFGETANDIWKSDNLDELKEFVKRNLEIDVHWMELEIGEKLVFSECEKYSLETCPSHYKSLHLIPTIGELKRLIHCQN